MTTTEVPRSYCVKCGKMCDAAVLPFKEGVPQPGDFTVCAYCCTLMRFDEQLKLQRVSHADVVTLSQNPEIMEQLFKIQRAIKLRQQRN